ncbi:tetratricopeptide repeat protein [Xanthomonadaceae bacterium XH05]|nr:tetratricopeptide repeat protein [Xanthomonadaceae bacterium XH05]
MIAFWVICALLVLAALAFVLPPLLRRGVTDPHRDALHKAHHDGVLNEAEYAAKLAALGPADHAAVLPAARRTALALVLLIPPLAVGLYQKLGDTRVFDPAVQSVTSVMQDAQRAGLPPMEQAIAGLVERLAQSPDDMQGWLLLGRAYRSMERFDDARDALARALALAPDSPDILVESAEIRTLATPSRRFESEALALLRQALTIAPDHQRGLWLLGIAQFQAGDTDKARDTWNRLLDTLPADSPMRDTLRQRIDEIHNQMTADSAPESPATTGNDASSAPRLSVHVVLAPELAERVSPDDVLFVFARAAEGSRAPLAIQRLRAGDLPLSLTLDDSHAMVPQMNLSSAAQIVVGARISRSGTAQAQPGDLETLSAPLPNSHQATITLTIDQIVP